MAINIKPGVRFQRDQILPFGCCFRTSIEKPIKHFQPSKIRVLTQPKQRTDKKIQVTISRKRLSQTEERRNTPITKRGQKLVAHIGSQKKSADNWQGLSSLASKMIQQKNGPQQLKVTFERHVKTQGIFHDTKFPNLLSDLGQKQIINKQMFMLSQISIVEQSFMSPDSMSNPLFTFLQNGQNDHMRQSYKSLLSNDNFDSKVTMSPFQKLNQAASKAKGEHRVYI